jgi:hypothetical protein
MKTKWALTFLFAILPPVLCLAPTDSISDADPAQSGYLPNHNINPAVVNSSAFQILWDQTFNAQEVVHLCKKT